MNIPGEIYYLIGKPNKLKHRIIKNFYKLIEKDDLVIMPKTVTTNSECLSDEIFSHVDKVDYQLRERMGLYCLNWKKENNFYAISGEVTQLQNRGSAVLLNGSLQNVHQALKVFPQINVVMVNQESRGFELKEDGYVILENEDSRLEWVLQSNGIYCPFILTVLEEDTEDRAADLLLEFVKSGFTLMDVAV